MKYSVPAVLTAILAARDVAAHATFQDLWVDGTDYESQCARLPVSNSPVADVTSADLACNAGTSAVTSKCPVTAGSTVTGTSLLSRIITSKYSTDLEPPHTVEMHQQPGDRSCSNEAIGGSHYGPVLVYMAAVDDAASAAGEDAGWFKVFEDTWAANGTSGSEDNWGTKDLNTCCGMMDVVVPEDLAPGDYLLRAEAIALHSAGGEGGAQFYSMSPFTSSPPQPPHTPIYIHTHTLSLSRSLARSLLSTNKPPSRKTVTCYQITVTGTGSASPDTVSLPGAYDASDPGILINIYQSLDTYEAPGPTVYEGGSTKSAGAPCANCESTCTAGSGATGVASSGAAAAATTAAATTSAEAATTTAASSSSSVATSADSSTSSTAAATTAAAVASSSSSSAYPASTPSAAAEDSSSDSSESTCKKRRSRIARNF